MFRAKSNHFIFTFQNKNFYGIITLVSLIPYLFFCFVIQNAHAATITSFSVTASRLKVNELADYEIKFVSPTGVSDGDSIVMDVSSDFDLDGAFDFQDVDIATGSTNNCATATFTEQDVAETATASAWGVDPAIPITFYPNGDGIVADTCTRILIGANAVYGNAGTSRISNLNADDDDTISLTTSSDYGIAAIDIITDDQVVVTATVQPTLTFAISDSTIEFGNLSASDDTFADDSAGNATEVEAHTLAASTNAAGGYAITLNGATLTDGAKTIDAIGSSNTATSVGSEQFGVRFTASGGSGAVTAPYAASGFAFDTAAFPDEVAASTVPSATTTYSARYIANIASTTEAGSYSATLTYIGTGRF